MGVCTAIFNFTQNSTKLTNRLNVRPTDCTIIAVFYRQVSPLSVFENENESGRITTHFYYFTLYTFFTFGIANCYFNRFRTNIAGRYCKIAINTYAFSISIVCSFALIVDIAHTPPPLQRQPRSPTGPSLFFQGNPRNATQRI